MEYRRLNPLQVRPEVQRAMATLGRVSSQGDIEKSLLELVKLRASQINGCGFCIGMHAARCVTDTVARSSHWRETQESKWRETTWSSWTRF